jgi:CBS domain containing-hemolysin-like protein
MPVAASPGEPNALFHLLSLLVLIAINAFFVAAEFSMVSVRRSRIDQLVASGDGPAKIVQRLQRNMDRLLSTTQLGITLSSLALGWSSERALAAVMTTWLERSALPPGWGIGLANVLATPVVFLAIAYLQIVIGELSPKSIALQYPEQVARVLGPPSWAISRLFHPWVWLLNQSTRRLLRFLGVRNTEQSWYHQVTSEELQLILSTPSESTGGLEAEERELLSNVFEFNEVLVEAVMVPRTSIDAIPDTATFQELLNEMIATGHTYYPVMRDSLDDVRGMIDLQVLAKPLASGELNPDTPIRPWVKPAWFVDEGTTLGELLRLMQKYRLGAAMVRESESSGTAGLVTLKDVLNEMTGDTYEPANTEQEQIRELDYQTFLIQAQADLEQVNERLSVALPLVDDYQTLAGFLLYQLQKIPDQGETYRYENLLFTVTAMDGPRLDQIQVQFLSPEVRGQDSDPSLLSEEPPAAQVEANELDAEASKLNTQRSEAQTSEPEAR